MTKLKKIGKRAIGLVLAAAMVFSLGAVPAFASGNGPKLSGSGTERDPYLIEDLDDLLELQSYINADGGSQAFHYYRQTANIDLSSIANWTPIGDTDTTVGVTVTDIGRRFSGVYDGDGHSITNMTITTSDGACGIGLFGTITLATIKDLTVSGTINHTKVAGQSALYDIGGIVGLTTQLYSDDPDELNADSTCHIIGCTSNVNITAEGMAGGVCGTTETDTYFTNCEYNGSITVSLSSQFSYASYGIGGICGASQGYDTFTGCVNNGTIVCNAASTAASGDASLGGIVGWTHNGAITTIDSCINTGTLTSYGSSGDTGVGGIVGKRVNGYDTGEHNMMMLSNCYNTGVLTAGQGSGTTGGIVGRTTSVDAYGEVIWTNENLQNCYSEADKATYIVRGFGYGAETPSEAGYNIENNGKFDELTELNGLLSGSYISGTTQLAWQNPNMKYTVAIDCIDGSTGKAISANLSVDYQSGLKSGQYPFTASKSGYQSVSGSFCVNRSDKTVYLTLYPTTYDYSVIVLPAGALVTLTDEGGVTIPEKSRTVSGGGMNYTYALNSWLYGDYSYTASCFGYEAQSGSVTAHEAEGMTLTLTEAARHNVVFAVTNIADGSEIGPTGVSVYSTDFDMTVPPASGGYSLPDGSYTVTVTAQGFKTVTQDFAVSGGDLTVDIAMSDDIWNGSDAETGWYSADESSFYIYTTAQLAGFAGLVNGGVSFAGKTVYLMNDLDLGKCQWTPIGSGTATAFKGVFDGQGHTICNLTLNIPRIYADDSQTGYYLASFLSNHGLFGYVCGSSANHAAIRDLTVVAASGELTSGDWDALAAQIETSADRISVSSYQGTTAVIAGYATYTDFENVDSDGVLYAGGNNIGGIAGAARLCSFTRCENSAVISGSFSVGGIAGSCELLASEFTACKNTGDISAYFGTYISDKTAHGIGGILGSSAVTSSAVNIDRCLNLGTVGGNSELGGIAGAAANINITNCYNAGAVAISDDEVILTAAYTNEAGEYVEAVYDVQDGLSAGGILGYAIAASVENCYDRAAVTSPEGEENTAALLAGAVVEGTFTNNRYLSARGEDDNGAAFDEAESYDALITALGGAYCPDIMPAVNSGFPILTWQNEGYRYNIIFAVGFDSDVNRGEAEPVVTLDGVTVTGVGVSVAAGSHSFSVSLDGYETVNGTIPVICRDITENVTMTAMKYRYVISASTGATVVLTLGGATVEPVTNDGGVYTYELYNGEYDYVVVKPGYTSKAGSFTVSCAGGRTAVSLTAAPTYPVAFTLSDGATHSALNEWTVEIFEAGVSCGVFALEDSIALHAGDYTYKMTMLAYEDAAGSFSVTADGASVSVEMTKITAPVWSGGSDTGWYTGASPYYIYDAEDLAGLAVLVNAGNTFSGGTIYLMNDLDLGSAYSWTSIGKANGSGLKPFSGIFDGNGHSITNNGSYAGDMSAGLFGYTDGATIKNLVLGGAVTVAYTGSDFYIRVGGLIGWAKGTTIQNVSNRMNLTATVAHTGSFCYMYAAGLVGQAGSCTVTASNSTGAVTGSATGSGGYYYCYAGGIAGETESTAYTGCYASGAVCVANATASYAFGFASRGSGTANTATNCYATGTAANGAYPASVSLTNCYRLDTLSGSGTAVSAETMQSESFATGLGSAFRYVSGSFPLNSWETGASYIAVSAMPAKTQYNDLDDFDDSGMTITVYFESGASAAVNSGWTILNGERLTDSQTGVVISYLGKKTVVPVTVTKVEHEIANTELDIALTAPRAGEMPGDISLSDEQAAKFTALVEWTQAGAAFEGEFEENVFYRANITLSSNYGEIWYVFGDDAAPAVDGAYQILGSTLSEDGRTLTFTAAYEISMTLTDETSHLYHEGESKEISAALDTALTVTFSAEGEAQDCAESSVRAVETLAFEGFGIETDEGFAGVPLYSLLSAMGGLVAADDESVVTIGETRLTLGAVRAGAGANCLLAYGQNGVPFDSGSPLKLVTADKNGAYSAGNDGITEISIAIVPAETYEATFICTGILPDGSVLTVRDANGNTVYSGGLTTVTLSGNCTWTAVMPGCATQSGVVSGAGFVRFPAVSAWDGTYSEPATDVSGTYLIGTADELAWFNLQSTRVSIERSVEMASANVRLTADINMSGFDWIPISPVEQSGNLSSSVYFAGGAYTGTFDGNGHTIYNLSINRYNPYSYAARFDGVGLFGYTKGATIRDLGVEGSIVLTDNTYSTAAEWLQVGGIAGFATATVISGCYTDMDISIYVDHSVDANGNVSVKGAENCDTYIGGIAGSVTLGSTIENCYSRGTIYGECTRSIAIGGILGASRMTAVSFDEDTGEVIARYDNIISKCWSDADITADPDATGVSYSSYYDENNELVYVGVKSYVSGIVGLVGSVSADYIPNISYCFALSDRLSGCDGEYLYAGRIVGNGDLFASNGNYNYGLSTMSISGAKLASYDPDASGYRTGWGKDVTPAQALLDYTYTDIMWNYNESTGDTDGDIWYFSSGSYPVFTWQDKAAAAALPLQDIVDILPGSASGAAEASGIVLTGPAGGWFEGENTFTVSSTNACVVIQVNGSGDSRRLNAVSAGGGSCSYVADGVAADTRIHIYIAGDADLDGEVGVADVTLITKAALTDGSRLDAELRLAVDVDGDGHVTVMDVLGILSAALGKNSLSW